MKTITRNVFSYCDIPDLLVFNSWIGDYQKCDGCYIRYTINTNNSTSLDKWFIDNHPELIGQEFLIEIDY